MMRNEADYLLDDLLSRWFQWARGAAYYNPPGADPMFRNAKSSRGYDTVDEVIEGELSASTMKAVDFAVNEIAEPMRSAIHAHARNLCSRVAVWSSPRLPVDPQERAVLLGEAKTVLMRRLLRAGVL